MQRESQQSSGRGGVQPVSVSVDIKSARCEIFAVDEAEIGHGYSAFSRSFVILMFLHSDIGRIVCVSEFDNPVSFRIREDCLRTRASAVAAIVEQQPGIVVLLLPEHFKGNRLQPVKIVDLLFAFQNYRR